MDKKTITDFQSRIWRVVQNVDIDDAEEYLKRVYNTKTTDEYLDQRIEDDDTNNYLITRCFEQNGNPKIYINLAYGDNDCLVKDIEMWY